MCKSVLGLPSFEIKRGSWKAAGFWNCEKSGETSDEVTVLITLEAQGVKRPLREAEVWYHVVWSFSEENPVENIVKGTIQL